MPSVLLKACLECLLGWPPIAVFPRPSGPYTCRSLQLICCRMRIKTSRILDYRAIATLARLKSVLLITLMTYVGAKTTT